MRGADARARTLGRKCEGADARLQTLEARTSVVRTPGAPMLGHGRRGANAEGTDSRSWQGTSAEVAHIEGADVAGTAPRIYTVSKILPC